jgi:hypothetical protein
MLQRYWLLRISQGYQILVAKTSGQGQLYLIIFADSLTFTGSVPLKNVEKSLITTSPVYHEGLSQSKGWIVRVL